MQKNADVSSHVTLETCLTRKILSVVYTDHVCKVSYLSHDLHNAMPNSPHYYNFIKKHFDVELLFTDKDSLTYEIKSEDVYEEFFKHKHLFDFSNYPKDSKFFDEANKKVIGKIKDESEGKIIDEFVGLKSKMHYMKNSDGKESNTAKIGNIATEFNEFKDTLFNKKIIIHKMRRIQGRKDKMGTYKINKIS